MSKLKSHRGAAKRFKKTKSGRIKCKQANSRHILTKEPAKRKRQRRGITSLGKSDVASVEQMLPHS